MPEYQSEIISALQRGAQIITANERLARDLRLAVADKHQHQGTTVWVRPPILSWPAWQQQCLDELLERALLGEIETPPADLKSHQVEAVWESIIERSAAGRGLLQTGATALAAVEAWDLLCGWQVPLSELSADSAGRTGDEAAGVDDIHAFADWAHAYQRCCACERWLDPAQATDYLTKQLRAGHLTAGSELVLAGFDELRPQQQAYVNAYRQAGGQVTLAAAPVVKPAAVGLHPCLDTTAECRAAANWARAILQREPGARIGIVVHDLAAIRSLIVRIVDECLRPGARLPGDTDQPPLWNVSLGTPLSDTPLIHDALQWLTLGAGPVEWPVASGLLRSPFMAGADTEHGARARLDARLRRKGLARLSLNDLCFWSSQAEDCPQLSERLQSARNGLRELPSRQSAGAWAGVFSQFLNTLGWSRGRVLDSHEYQTVQAWWNLLAEFAGLDAFTPGQGWLSALQRLRVLAGRRLFQPQSPPAPVQILGLLETSGLTFDYLWIMGLHDGHWPASPRPHPFIPVQLQRRYQMPHASAERELEFAQQATKRLLASAEEIVVSWPQRDGDAELRPSPLFNGLGFADQRVQLTPDLMHVIHGHSPAVSFTDVMPPALSDAEPLRGGTAVLKNQAACPFRAFATHRLHATVPEEPEPGLDALARGSLVHAVMQAVWETLRERSALQQEQSALRSLVSECVEQAVSGWERDNHHSLPPRFRAVECTRLTSLALDWLRLDAERGDFTVVAREAEQALEIGGLTLRGRLDRLDRLPDGRCLIIDYKTGQVDPKVWLDERPDDPQLPLYALAHRRSVAGVAFAQVRVGDVKYAGVAAEADCAPGLVAVSDWKARPEGCDDLPALLDYWQTQLNALAAAFRVGVAEVDPKDPRRTCTYCKLGPLCRIDELSQGRHDLERVDSDD